MINNRINSELTGMQNRMYDFARMLTCDERTANALMQDTNALAVEQDYDHADRESMCTQVLRLMRNVFIAKYNTYNIQTSACSIHEISVSIDGKCLDTPEGTLPIESVNTYITSLAGDDHTIYSMYCIGYSVKDIAHRLNMSARSVTRRIGTLHKIFR